VGVDRHENESLTADSLDLRRFRSREPLFGVRRRNFFHKQISTSQVPLVPGRRRSNIAVAAIQEILAEKF
jgi:hypothetical protein